MSNFSDQRGNPINKEELFNLLSESILANLMAFDEAGISRKEVKMIVGPDGGTIIGGGAMFQTPVTKKLSDEDGRQLFDKYAGLLKQYDAGLLSAERISNIRSRNNVDKKVSVIRQSLQ
jgi:hypothetical protein